MTEGGVGYRVVSDGVSVGWLVVVVVVVVVLRGWGMACDLLVWVC